MKISFPLFVKNSSNNPKQGVWGDEVICNILCKILQKAGHEPFTYQVNEKDIPKADVSIVNCFNMIHPKYLKKHGAGKYILWIQGFNYSDKQIIPLDMIYNATKDYYDLTITSSRTLAKQFNLPFLVPPVDFDSYYPIETPEIYDISLIGNIIKNTETNKRFLSPLSDFNYGLFGGDWGKVGHEKWLEIVNGSKINLHYGFDEGIKWNMVSGSPLFINACRKFLISDKVPYLMETFGDSMAFTEGGEQEKEQIKYYLENKDLREKMSMKAYEAVRSINQNELVKIIGGI